MTTETAQILNTIEVRNPFNPQERVIGTLPYVPGKSLAEYFPEVMGAAHPLVIAHNGRIIPLEERALVIPDAGDFVVNAWAMAGGGGDSKGILRIAAMLAVVVAAPWAASALLGITGAAAIGSLGVSMVTAGISIAGSMLVNSLLPVPKADTSGTDSSATYGIDGAKNSSAENLPVPLIYGRYRYGGNILNSYTVNDGDTQFLHVLYCAGEGPIAGISGIMVNDIPLTEYKDVLTEVRLGTPNQEIIPWFAASTVPTNVNHKLTQDWFNYSTSGPVDQLRLDFAAPGGLSDGGKNAVSVAIEIQYAVADSNDWQTLPGGAGVGPMEEKVTWIQVPRETTGGDSYTWPYTPTGAEIRVGDDYFIDTVNEDGTTTRTQVGSIQHSSTSTGGFKMEDNRTTVVRRSYQSNLLSEGSFKVRVRRTTKEATDGKKADIVILTDINEITTERVGYYNTALLAVRIKLTDQLSSFPTITHINGGKLVNIWNDKTNAWEMAPSSNPAWISLDAMTNRRYGGGEPMSRFDLERWKEWARYCDAEGLTFNGVFDTTSTVWDATQEIFRCGHAQRLDIGTKRSVIIERPEPPRMMFSVANILTGTFKETWLPTTERANEIEITFNDGDHDYKPRTIRLTDGNALVPGQNQRSSTITLKGVTTYERAWKDGRILLNMNRLLQRTISFSAPLEAIACVPGSVVLVQHDMPSWGLAGRAEAGSTKSVVKLDRPVTMYPGASYKLLVHVSASRKFTGSVASVLGDTVNVSSFDGSSVQRMVVNGVDHEISTIYQNGPYWAISLTDASGIMPGSHYELWETDGIETRDVVNPASGGAVTATEVTVTSPLGTAPEQFVQWMFGQNQKVAKPFRIKSISGTQDYRRDIVALEYNENIYNPEFTGEAPNFSDLDRGTRHVINLEVDEELVDSGTSYYSRVTVHYQGDQSTYSKADVYVSRNGAQSQLVGADPRAVTVDAAEGDTLVFQVVAFDVNGRSAPKSGAPTIEYVVLGKVPPPESVKNFEVVPEPAGWLATWDIPVSELITATQIRVDRDDSTNWSTSESTFTGKTQSTTLPFMVAGVRRIRARFAVGKVVSAEDAIKEITVLHPGPASLISCNKSARSFQITYADPHTTQPIAYIEFRCYKTDAIEPKTWEQSTLLGSAGGAALSHTITFDRGGNYTILWRAYDMAKNEGPISAVEVEAYQDIDDILDGIEGKILASHLAQDLLAAIEDIPGIDELLTAVDDSRDALASTVINSMLNADQALASSAVRAKTELGEAVSAISHLETSTATASEALARSLTVVAAELDDAKAVITTESVARATTDDAVAQLSSTVAVNYAGNQAAIADERVARANAVSAQASQITGLTATVGSNYAAQTQRTDALVNADTAFVGQLTSISTDLNGVKAVMVTQTQVQSTVNTAIVNVLTTLRAETATSVAGLQSQQEVSSTINGAIASNNTIVNARIGDVETKSQITQNAVNNLDGNVSSSTMIKSELLYNGKRYMAGLAVGVSKDSAGNISSEVLVNAWTFGVINEIGGNVTVPFSVVDGVTYIRKAIIKNADIDTLKIAGQSVTVPGYTANSVSDLTLNYSIPADTEWAPYQVFISATLVSSYFSNIHLLVNGAAVRNEAPTGGSIGVYTYVTSMYPGDHTIRIYSDDGRNNNYTSIFALASRR